MQLNNFFLQSCALSLNLYTQTDSQKAFQIVQDNVIKSSDNQVQNIKFANNGIEEWMYKMYNNIVLFH